MTDQRTIADLGVGDRGYISSQDISLVKIISESPLQFSSVPKNDDIIKLFRSLKSHHNLFLENGLNFVINPSATIDTNNKINGPEFEVTCLKPTVCNAGIIVEKAAYALAAIIQVNLEDADDIKYIESIMSVDKQRLQAGLLTVDYPTNIIRNNLFKILQYIIDKYFLMEVIGTHISIDTLDNEEVTLIDNDIIDNIVMQIGSNINSYVLKTEEIKISTLLKNNIIHFFRYISDNHVDGLVDYDSAFLGEQEILISYLNTLYSLDSSEVLEIEADENEIKILQIPEIAASIDNINEAFDNLITINGIDPIRSNLYIIDDYDENDEITLLEKYSDLQQRLTVAIEDEDYKTAGVLQDKINHFEVEYHRLLDE